MSNLPSVGKENEYGKNIDKCITDLAIKVGTGVIVGGVFSLLFRRKAWPMTLGGGIGLGMSYSNCENRFRSHYVDGFRLKPKPNQPPSVEEIPDVVEIVQQSTDTPSNSSQETTSEPKS
uniref:MICOS complex subunit MIC10 n=1 Tax=Phallusia mammillata TaxID=59560 RepID=A0A6F9DLJ1_9ASCI|nr:MICOS complex subunit Mic10-like [Phallusia mammillata]